MKKTANLLIALLVILVAAPTYAEKIGSIKNVEGGGIGIILLDDTIISMGPGSTMELDEFLFKPEKKQFSMVARFVKGTFTYLSGIIAKIAPEAVQIETPDGMVAVRGTHFLVKVK